MDNIQEKVRLNKSGIFAILAPFRMLIISAVSYFLAAGTFSTPRFHLFLTIGLCGAIVGAAYLAKMPDLANSRGKSQPGTKRWDLYIVVPYILLITLVIPCTAALDTVRFEVSSMGWFSFCSGVILYILSFILIQWSMLVNHHFEGTVRIQEERNHQVIASGPYRIVRHPGYAGMLIFGLSSVLMLGSYYSYIPMFASVTLLIIRTVLEDRMLKDELDGYVEYSLQTRYRLVPMVW